MNLEGWLPAWVAWRGGEPRIQWTLMRGQRLTEPFYRQTLEAQMMQPFHAVFRRETSMEELEAWTAEHPGVPLKGLIFHMSRCGSTLMSRMLAAVERNVVVSEPDVIDAMVRADSRATGLARETQVRWLRAMAAALGQQRVGGEDGFYLKLDAWHVRDMELFAQAFSGVPWVFLYRSPLEVLVSNVRNPGVGTLGMQGFEMQLRAESGDWAGENAEYYWARILAAICEGGLSATERFGGKLVNYSELPGAMVGRLREFFGCREEDVATMMRVAGMHAKRPGRAFTADAERKRDEATELERELCREWLEPLYARLEMVRRAQQGGDVVGR